MSQDRNMRFAEYLRKLTDLGVVYFVTEIYPKEFPLKQNRSTKNKILQTLCESQT
jgi:hypothetical protein